MKKIIMAAVASTVMFSGSAFAQLSPNYQTAQYGQDAIGWYALQANGQTFCRFGVNNAGQNGVNTTVTTSGFGGVNEADGTFTFDIQNDNTNTVQAASGQYNINNVVCNTPFTVTARSDNGGLRSANYTSDTAFATLVKYSVDFDFDGLNGTPVSSSTTDQTILVGGEARAGAAVLTVSTQASNDLVIQGAYSDKLTLTMTPNVGSVPYPAP